MILDRYFARRFLLSFGGVFAVFTMILGFIALIEQLRRLSGVDVSFAQVAGLALLSLPQAVYTILPLIMIIAAIALFLGLARSSELVVARAAGRSGLRALLAPLATALAVGVLMVAVMNPIVAGTSRELESRETALRGSGSVLTLGETGLWLRQGGEAGQTVIRAARANLSGTALQDVTFLMFAPSGAPVRRIAAASATLGEGRWDLTDTKSWPLTRDAVAEAAAETRPALRVPSTLTPDQIRDSFGTPSSIPIWDLPAFIARLKAAGFSAQRHEVWLQMELALPLFLVAMVMIAASFTMRPQRGGRTGMMVLFALLVSFALYFLRNFAQILGENGQLPAVLAAWAPPLVAIGLSLGLLLHLEDG